MFDKTGTLTLGKPAVVDHRLFSSATSDLDIMRCAAAAEADSEHPVAQAILEYAHSQIHLLPARSPSMNPSLEGYRLLAHSPRLLPLCSF